MKKPSDYPDIIKSFSKKILTRRYEKQYTREKLAEMVGIHANTLQNIEKGVSDPSLTSVLKLSKILDISIDEMILAMAHDVEV